MVPQEYFGFFTASAGAGAALVGLLFVAISIAPDRIVTSSAPMERQAVAASAYTALTNAFFISMAALIPHLNLGVMVLIMSALATVSNLSLGWRLLRQGARWQDRVGAVRRLFLLIAGFVLYGYELWSGMRLIRAGGDESAVVVLVSILLGVYGLGLTRAWELLGARRGGLFGWLSILHEVDDGHSDSRTQRGEPAIGTPSPSSVQGTQRPILPHE